MPVKEKLSFLAVLMLLAPLALSACAQTPAPQLATVPVQVTRIVEQEGQQVTIVETQIVEVTAPPPDRPAGPKVLVVGQPEEPDTLYTFASFVLASAHVQQAFRDGPIDNRSYSYQPVILEKLPSLEDGDAVFQTAKVNPGDRFVQADAIMTATQEMELEQMVVTFKIKPGLKWEDGTPLTADDSVFGWQLACDPATPSGKFVCERSAGYVAVDDFTTVWTGLPGYQDPTYFINFGNPMPRHVLGDLVASRGAGAVLESEFARKPIGWGAFKVEKWEAGQYIHVVRNEHYFRASEGLPYLDEIFFKFIPDSRQLLAQLLSGELDIVTQDGVDVNEVRTLLDAEAQGIIKPYFVGDTIWEHIDFNILPADGRVPFFADRRIRQAVAYGTDRQAMVDDVMYGKSSVLHSFLPQEHPFYPRQEGAIAKYDYDPEKAKVLLEEVGWKDLDGDRVREAHTVTYGLQGWDFVNRTYAKVIPLAIPDGTPFRVTLQAIEGDPIAEQTTQIFQRNMKDIGIEVQVELLTPWSYFADGPDGPLFGRRFDLGQLAWLTGPEPPCELYMADQIPDATTGWGGQNETGYVSRAYDEACTGGRSHIAATERAPYFAEVQRILSEDLPVLPLFQHLKVSVARPQVKNLILDPTEYSEMWNVEAFDLEE